MGLSRHGLTGPSGPGNAPQRRGAVNETGTGPSRAAPGTPWANSEIAQGLSDFAQLEAMLGAGQRQPPGGHVLPRRHRPDLAGPVRRGRARQIQGQRGLERVQHRVPILVR